MDFRKIKILALLALTVALLCAVSAAGEDADFVRDDPIMEEFICTREPQCDTFEASTSYSTISSATAQELLNYMYPKVKQAALTIDISGFRIPYTQAGADDVWNVWDLMNEVHRDIEYYAMPIYPKVSKDSTGRYVGYLKIETYKVWTNKAPISVNEILSTNAAIDKKIDEVVSGIAPDMSDLEKVLYIHDWLCVNGEYDSARLDNGTIPRSSYDIRGILLYGIGVCQSYTWSFDYIMDRYGIQCINVTSDGMNHTWNQVKLGGYWYNMDITWDDPVQDKLGRTRHEYFLCSDSDFQNKREHYGYYDGVSCTSTKYDNAFWKDVDTPMPYIKGETFYIKQTEGAIKAINIDTMSSVRTVWNITDKWSWYANYDYYKCCYFTFLAKYGNNLIFNDTDAIMSMNPDGSGFRTLKSFSTSDTGGIYGMRLRGSNLEYVYTSEFKGLIRANGSFSVFVAINSIKLPYENAKLEYGYYAMINAVVNTGADASRLIWHSSNPTVATVSAGGRVDTKKYGTTVITATSPDNSSVKATMHLTVYAKTTSISLANNPSVMCVGKNITLNVKLNTGALLNDVVWSSSNTSVLTVDFIGIVNTVGIGTATITARSRENSSVVATLKVTVMDGIPGDSNGDGVINATDAVVIAQYLAGWDTSCDTALADVNGDGKVNATDAVMIAQYIAGWSSPVG